jgi:hypothetical protein
MMAFLIVSLPLDPGREILYLKYMWSVEDVASVVRAAV